MARIQIATFKSGNKIMATVTHEGKNRRASLAYDDNRERNENHLLAAQELVHRLLLTNLVSIEDYAGTGVKGNNVADFWNVTLPA